MTQFFDSLVPEFHDTLNFDCGFDFYIYVYIDIEIGALDDLSLSLPDTLTGPTDKI